MLRVCSPRQAHWPLHLRLPGRERTRGGSHQAAHHRQSRAQGSGRCARGSRPAGALRRPAGAAFDGSVAGRGRAPPNARCQRIGPALLFERLWHEVGCRAVLEELAAGRQFEFAAERAVFLTVLHRLFVSGSDRAAEKWRADYRIEGTEALQLHHLYRAMAWLGEPLADQAGASELTPRCRQDLGEEGLFARRRDLFAELSVVFMDTTSLSFEGRGGEELGRRGHSKDYRPDLHQMIVGLVMDQDGRPLCCELWPGNTADVTALLPVVDRLRARFSVGRIGVVADRGMISAQSIAALEERKLEYVLGVRQRSSAEVRSTVIDDQTPLSRWSCRGFRASSPSSRPSRSKSATDGTSSVAISPRRGAMPSSAVPSSTGCAPR